MGKARRIRALRASQTQGADTALHAASGIPEIRDGHSPRLRQLLRTAMAAGSSGPFEPEFPSLDDYELVPAARDHLNRGRKKHEGRVPPPTLTPEMERAIGTAGSYPHANTSLLNEWLRGWEIQDPYPDLDVSRTATRSSGSLFVSVVDGDRGGAPESTASDPVYITLPTTFLERCRRLSEAAGAFQALVANEQSTSRMAQARDIVFEHADLLLPTAPELSDLLGETRDDIAVARESAAAMRWAIAHEYAHRMATPAEKQQAWREVLELWPGIEEEQWADKRDQLEYAGRALFAWRDEISCDILANWYVLRSPFTHDDAITQVNGALLGLDAAVWDGWFADRSEISETHPSPTLRFRISYRHWLRLLLAERHGVHAQRPSLDSVLRLAHWRAFERWAAGAYGDHRDGAMWRDDILQPLEVLVESLRPEPLSRTYVPASPGGFKRTVPSTPSLPPLWLMPWAVRAMADLDARLSEDADGPF